MRTSLLRASGPASALVRPRVTVGGLQQLRAAHAISNPTLANIEQRWTSMPPQEQADLWMALRDRMKTDWTELTLAEKKAGTCLDTSRERGLDHLRRKVSVKPSSRNVVWVS